MSESPTPNDLLMAFEAHYQGCGDMSCPACDIWVIVQTFVSHRGASAAAATTPEAAINAACLCEVMTGSCPIHEGDREDEVTQ